MRLIARAELLPKSRLVTLMDEAEQLANILGKSIVTAKANGRRTPT